MGDGGFNEDAAKTLEDYYVARVDTGNSFTFTGGPGGSDLTGDTTTVESPLLFLPVLVPMVMIVVLRKRSA